MKALAFLLLLDYSGSMNQTLQSREKIDILKEETVSLISTASPSSESVALVFGTDPGKACRDLKSLTLPTEKLSSQIKTLNPGNLGKTPLALGLKELVRQSIQKNAQLSLVVTDGADSCGQDPCKALIDGNALLAKAQKKLKVHIIGFDLKNENSKFECFKKLNLSNIDVSMSEASSMSDLQRKIREGQMNALEAGAALQDADTAKVKGLKKNAVASKGGGPGQDPKDKNKVPPSFDKKTEALLEVVGSPATANFSAVSSDDKRNWQGSYIVTLKAGSYNVRFHDPNGIELKLDLGAGTQTKIPWARLMKVAETDVILQASTLTLKWSPEENTKTVHGEVEELNTLADLDQTRSQNQKVPFGEWKLEVTSPPWLKGRIEEKKVQFYLGQTKQMNIEAFYQDQIKYVNNPRPNNLMVLRILYKGNSEERYPIQPGVLRLPIPADAQAKWILPAKPKK